MVNSFVQTSSWKKEPVNNSVTVGIATTQAEKKEIYRFRYQTYIEEMSKQIEGIDHSKKVLCDELDDWAMLLYAKVGSKLIGTARINIGTIEQYPAKLVQILSLDKFRDSFPESNEEVYAYVTKLMIAPPHRSSSALYLLIAKCYEICCANQVQFAFGACNFQLLRLYEQMGFHRYGKNFVDPGYGLLAPIVLLINDIQHFRMVRSPILRLARKRTNINTQAVEWFYAHLMKNPRSINSQIIEEDELWSLLCKRLYCPPTEAIEILENFSEVEAKKFLHSCSIYIHCHSGDIITHQGDMSYAYNLLISGKLKSLTFHHPMRYYATPGQSFGANGLTEHNPHTEDIAVVSTAEILVLSGIAFPRFCHAYPDIAHKVIRNLFNVTKSPLQQSK